jgi:hypothetical protein
VVSKCLACRDAISSRPPLFLICAFWTGNAPDPSCARSDLKPLNLLLFGQQ